MIQGASLCTPLRMLIYTVFVHEYLNITPGVDYMPSSCKLNEQFQSEDLYAIYIASFSLEQILLKSVLNYILT